MLISYARRWHAMLLPYPSILTSRNLLGLPPTFPDPGSYTLSESDLFAYQEAKGHLHEMSVSSLSPSAYDASEMLISRSVQALVERIEHIYH
jgi:hypothetical protein